jgi:predicted cobalt transporter CbtA
LLLSEELAPENLQSSEGPRRHRHPAPAAALAVEHREHESDTGALAWEPADHLGPAARLAVISIST